MNKTYWKGLDEKHQTPEFVERSTKEFQEDLTIDAFVGDEGISEFKTGRRDFLKFLGFGMAAATLASCEAPVIKSIPYVNKPEDITPGIANWYASSFYDGNDFANILIKTREGRPIWVKGNKSFGSTKGGLTPRIAASVLNLYNSDRLTGPIALNADSTWDGVDDTVKKELNKIARSGGKVRILTNSIISPSTQLAIDELIASLGGATSMMGGGVIDANENDPLFDPLTGVEGSGALKTNDIQHIQYDAVSLNAIRKANKASFGENIIPNYNFSRAKVIVGIDADFLANWLLHTEYSQQYTQTRKPEQGWMSRHYQFEAVMSLTGANADVRKAVKPSQYGALAAGILKYVGGKDLGLELDPAVDAIAQNAAADLKANIGQSLVVCGVNDVNIQIIVNAINQALNNYGKTIDLNAPLEIKKGDDASVESFVKEVIDGKVGAVVIYGCNPVYSLPNGAAFGEALANVELTVSMSEFADETASRCKYICPDHNYLESWNDYNPRMGEYALQQPVIRPLNDTRQAQESFLVWAGKVTRADRESQAFYDFIRAAWEQYGFPMQTEYALFEDYWNWAVHNGSVGGFELPAKEFVYTDATAGVKFNTPEGSFEIVAYQKVEMGEGQYAANPWLQELPDALTKVCWDNYVTMSPKDCYHLFGIAENPNKPISAWKGLYLGQEDQAYMVDVTVGEAKVTLPVYPLPGQAHGTIGIAVGYGRGANEEKIGKAAYQVRLDQTGEYIKDANGKKVPIGANAYLLTSFVNGNIAYNVAGNVAANSGRYNLACTQTHHTIMGRTSILKETSLNTFLAGDKNAYNHPHQLHVHEKGHGEHKSISEFNLWDEHPVEHVGHRWGLSIDLSACNGCGVCIVACHSENNVPVVGKDEVRRARDMQWLRMDRYFSSVDDDKRAAWAKNKRNGQDWTYDSLEVPEDEPTVAFMPMMCHHCNHAPCETVCPVAATTHSNEGLNMMAYNRCIGTRYCGNNCPYKVRRFNWFNYRDYKKFSKINPTHDEISRLVLNPDVTVRSRGVMEKCTFCLQRIQEGKLNAKKEGRVLVDGDVVSACADACPSGALTFGDWNDESSAVAEKTKADRAYIALEEVGTKPNVWYQVKVRNVEEEMIAQEHHNENHDHDHAAQDEHAH